MNAFDEPNISLPGPYPYMNEDLLTLKEIARRLNVPESSIRYYRDRFEDYIPARGEGRKRRYTRHALDIFRIIVQGYNNDHNAEEIKDHLEQQLQQSSLQTETSSSNISATGSTLDASSESRQDVLQSQARALSSLANLLVNKNRLEEEVHQLREEHQKIKKGLFLLWKKHKQIQAGPPQNAFKASAYQDIEKQLYDLHNELGSLQARQNELEHKQAQEMQEIRQMVEKCQFWIKRLMPCSKSENPEEDTF